MSRPRHRPLNIDTTLQELRRAHQGSLQVCSAVKINGPEYQAAQAAARAINDLAGQLTGDPACFHAKPHRTGSKNE